MSTYGRVLMCLVAWMLPMWTGAAEQGLSDYDANCAACHSLLHGEHRFGPSLAHIIGATAGSTQGYAFSTSYVEAGTNGLVWNEATLNAFLTRPPTLLGKFAGPPITNRMPIRVVDADIRRRVIAYLVMVSTGGSK